MSLLGDPSFEHDGVEYPYDLDDVLEMSGQTKMWVYSHESALGGRRFVRDGTTHLRFPPDVDERVHRELGES